MNKKLIGGTIIVLFVLLLFFGVSLMELQRESMRPEKGPNLSRNFTNHTIPADVEEFRGRMETNRYPMYYIVIGAALSGLLVGAIVYYVLSERKTNIDFDKKSFRKALLASLSAQEREVVNALLDNNGTIPQYELTRISGMNKVQTHRLLAKMEKKGLIVRKSLGKVNKIILNKNMKALI